MFYLICTYTAKKLAQPRRKNSTGASAPSARFSISEENHGDEDKHNDHDVDNYADDTDGDVVVDGDDADDVNDDDNYDEEDNRLAVKLLHLLRTPCWLARFVFTN